MINDKLQREYYKALLNKDSEYEGVFFAGIITTGIFCRPTCHARKPKFENCEFFETAEQALLASYRPCKRCQPLSPPNQVSNTIKKLVDAVEANPEKRWKEADFRELSIDESTARRQFKKRFGMTFIQYARARRLGLALGEIRRGKSVIHSQLESGYESSSGFRDAFAKIFEKIPSQSLNMNILTAAWIDTKLGSMVAISDEHSLYLLEFVDRRGLEREIERLRKKTKSVIIPGTSQPIRSITLELESYFSGEGLCFTTPVKLIGSDFQRKVWQSLQKISPGETYSYAELAASVGNPTAYRAVARANGLNQLALIIPCHRIINSNGELGGYGGGLTRKQWLINHEKKYA